MTKRVIVTGATAGIGRATALLLADEGYQLVLAGRREAELEEVATECSERGAVTQYLKTDVANPNDCHQLVHFARALGPDVYPVLINCAGAVQFGAFDEMPLDQLQSQVDVNLNGPLHLCHWALPWMLDAGGGQIVNVVSVASYTAFSGGVAYCASKAALLMLGKSLAAEYRTRGIKVTSISPGSTDTALWAGQSFQPERLDMLPTAAVAEAIRDVIKMPHDRNIDELRIMPPKGIL